MNGEVRRYPRGILSIIRMDACLVTATGCTHSSLNVYFSFRIGITGAYDALFACGFRC